MFLPVDDDGGDLLVHEQQDGEQDGGEGRQKVDVPGRLVVIEGNQPAPDVRSCRLDTQY